MVSVKDGFDSMPIAVCFFNSKGVVRLINRKMLSVGSVLSETGIQTLSGLRDALSSPPESIVTINSESKIYQFPDGEILRFKERKIVDSNGAEYIQVTAADVTELIDRHNELRKENEQLLEANNRARQLYENMAEIVREEEILTMKMRVHDDIGHGILAARRALLSDYDLERIKNGVDEWQESVEILHHANKMTDNADRLSYVKKRAEALGITLSIEGDLPQSEKLVNLIILVIRECVTNCARHANGNRVNVSVSKGNGAYTVKVTNNGIKPQSEIVEGGGLSSLRKSLEKNNGVMKVQSFPEFALTVTLKEAEI